MASRVSGPQSCTGSYVFGESYTGPMGDHFRKIFGGNWYIKEDNDYAGEQSPTLLVNKGGSWVIGRVESAKMSQWESMVKMGSTMFGSCKQESSLSFTEIYTNGCPDPTKGWPSGDTDGKGGCTVSVKINFSTKFRHAEVVTMGVFGDTGVGKSTVGNYVAGQRPKALKSATAVKVSSKRKTRKGRSKAKSQSLTLQQMTGGWNSHPEFGFCEFMSSGGTIQKCKIGTQSRGSMPARLEVADGVGLTQKAKDVFNRGDGSKSNTSRNTMTDIPFLGDKNTVVGYFDTTGMNDTDPTRDSMNLENMNRSLEVTRATHGGLNIIAMQYPSTQEKFNRAHQDVFKVFGRMFGEGMFAHMAIVINCFGDEFTKPTIRNKLSALVLDGEDDEHFEEFVLGQMPDLEDEIYDDDEQFDWNDSRLDECYAKVLELWMKMVQDRWTNDMNEKFEMHKKRKDPVPVFFFMPIWGRVDPKWVERINREQALKMYAYSQKVGKFRCDNLMLAQRLDDMQSAKINQQDMEIIKKKAMYDTLKAAKHKVDAEAARAKNAEKEARQAKVEAQREAQRQQAKAEQERQRVIRVKEQARLAAVKAEDERRAVEEAQKRRDFEAAKRAAALVEKNRRREESDKKALKAAEKKGQEEAKRLANKLAKEKREREAAQKKADEQLRKANEQRRKDEERNKADKKRAEESRKAADEAKRVRQQKEKEQREKKDRFRDQKLNHITLRYSTESSANFIIYLSASNIADGCMESGNPESSSSWVNASDGVTPNSGIYKLGSSEYVKEVFGGKCDNDRGSYFYVVTNHNSGHWWKTGSAYVPGQDKGVDFWRARSQWRYTAASGKHIRWFLADGSSNAEKIMYGVKYGDLP